MPATPINTVTFADGGGSNLNSTRSSPIPDSHVRKPRPSPPFPPLPTWPPRRRRKRRESSSADRWGTSPRRWKTVRGMQRDRPERRRFAYSHSCESLFPAALPSPISPPDGAPPANPAFAHACSSCALWSMQTWCWPRSPTHRPLQAPDASNAAGLSGTPGFAAPNQHEPPPPRPRRSTMSKHAQYAMRDRDFETLRRAGRTQRSAG